MSDQPSPAPTQTFLQVMDAADFTTGGGSAAALSGAMAAALVAMVCRFSARKADDPARQTLAEGACVAAARARQLTDGAAQDAQAFQAVALAYRRPKDTPSERAARQHAIQAAWQQAAQVPLENATECWRVLQQGLELRPHADPKVASDLKCALLLAHAACLGCLENVAINLPALTDPAAVTALERQAHSLRQQAAAAADQITAAS